jgi:hypothetical protein
MLVIDMHVSTQAEVSNSEVVSFPIAKKITVEPETATKLSKGI